MSVAPDLSTLPRRSGDRPETHHQMPHQQVSQNAPSEFQEALFERIAALPGVVVGQSHVSVPGARAFHLEPEAAGGDGAAFMAGTEFAHLHPAYDASLHILLPEAAAPEVIDPGGGGVPPPLHPPTLPPPHGM